MLDSQFRNIENKFFFKLYTFINSIMLKSAETSNILVENQGKLSKNSIQQFDFDYTKVCCALSIKER